jgi:hypothetical protein
MSAIDAAAQPRTLIGVVVALAAAACFSLANTAASIAEGGGSSPLTISAIRFLVPAAALVVWLRLSGVSLAMPRRAALVSISMALSPRSTPGLCSDRSVLSRSLWRC